MNKKCKILVTHEDGITTWEEAIFIGVFQKSYVYTPMLKGHVGGTVAYPIVVVSYKGRLLELETINVSYEV